MIFTTKPDLANFGLDEKINSYKEDYMSVKGQAAIIGIGEVPTGVFPDRSLNEIAVRSSIEAIKNAGIDKNEIDAIITTGILADRLVYEVFLLTGKLVQELGLRNKVKTNIEVFSGGSSSCDMLKTATGLINIGQANTVLCVHADKLATCANLQQVLSVFTNAMFSAEWEIPFGATHAVLNDWFEERFMHDTGTTKAQIASIVVSNRKWGNLNPNAAYREIVTLEEVLAGAENTRPGLCDGGAAFLVTSAERAKKASKPVYVLGESSRCSRALPSFDPDILIRESYATAAKEAFAEAGLTPADMDFAEIYEAYAVVQLMAYEELGFAKRGEGGAFFEAGYAAPGGKFPVTTNGGMLSQGHTGAGGGFALLVEAVRQLKGEAGKRQVPNAKYGVYTGTGGAFNNAAVTVLGTQIPE